MNKYTVLMATNNDDGTTNYHEEIYFAVNSKDIKSLGGYKTITKTERVNHPSPEIMQRTILKFQLDEKVIDLSSFYAECNKMQDEFDKEEAEKVANGDEGAIKRAKRKEEMGQAKQERIAKQEAERTKTEKKSKGNK